MHTEHTLLISCGDCRRRVMYRQDQEKRMAESMEGNQLQFLNRVVKYPMIATAMTQLGSLYSSTKGSHPVMNYTLGTAESGLVIVANTAKPMVKKLEKPIGALDNLACNQLDKLQEKFPVITHPTEQVVNETREMCQTAVAPAVKRAEHVISTYNSARQYATDTVTGVKDYGMSKVNGVKTYSQTKIQSTITVIQGMTEYGVSTINGARDYGVRTLEGARDYGVSKLEGARDYGVARAERYIPTIQGSVDTLLTGAELGIDCMLPAEEGDVTEEKLSGHMETSSAMLARTQRLAQTVHRRVRRRAVCRFQNIHDYGQTAVKELQLGEKLTIFAPAMDMMTTRISATQMYIAHLRDRIQQLWIEINKSEEEAAADRVGPSGGQDMGSQGDFERRLVVTARHMTQRFKNTTTLIVNSTTTVTTAMQSTFSDAITLPPLLYYIFTSTHDKMEGIVQLTVNAGHDYLSVLPEGLANLPTNMLSWLVSPYVWLSVRVANRASPPPPHAKVD